MARIETDPNYTAPTFSRATAGTDLFKKEDVQGLASAVSTHDHTSGKGLPLAAGAIPNGTITSAMIADGTIVAGDIADGAVTSAKILDGTIQAVDHADASVTNAKLAADTARANLLTNGGFEVWQRGGAAVTTGFTADRWLIEGIGLSVIQEGGGGNPDIGSQFAARVTYNGTASNLSQFVEAYPGSLRGRTISVSVRVRGSVANCARITINSDGTGSPNVQSALHTGDGTYQTLSAAGAVIPADASKVYVRIGFSGAAGTFYVDNAMLVVGSVPADYAPLHPADDLARCQRYYEILGGQAGELDMIIRARAAAGGQIEDVTFPFKVQKAVTATATIVGTWGVGNCAQPTIVGVSKWGCRAEIASTGAGDFYALNSGAGQYITVEANP